MKCQLILVFPFVVLLLAGFCRAVTIRRLIVPRWVRNGSETPAVLDCEYVYNENDLKLVVKWFFNDGAEPVYQWIPEMGVREAFGVLRQRLDDTFSVNSRDAYSQYRAIRILRPTWELSGKYTCVVTSLAGQDARHQHMTIFVPAKSFSFNYSDSRPPLERLPRPQSPEPPLSLLCMARGMFPKPVLTLFLLKGGKRRPATEAGLRTFTTATVEDGLFDVALHADAFESHLSSLADLFECVLEIPYSNYVLTRRMSLAHELTWGAYGASKASRLPILSLFYIALSISIYIASGPHKRGGEERVHQTTRDFGEDQGDT
ncbi:uncharacterized protein LOC142583128 [Dermacentor variabilis]|uniref:uncharacterized protein LOC142583128 n=1 Tax=Dermacentor variabilis TaxID=34621 RepID=UPI003F5BF676